MRCSCWWSFVTKLGFTNGNKLCYKSENCTKKLPVEYLLDIRAFSLTIDLFNPDRLTLQWRANTAATQDTLSSAILWLFIVIQVASLGASQSSSMMVSTPSRRSSLMWKSDILRWRRLWTRSCQCSQVWRASSQQNISWWRQQTR